MEGVSVVLCCYNSEKRLSETLRHLSKQKVEQSIPWELILINNCSTDRTKEIALAEWAKYQLEIPLSIFDETKAGLGSARMKGFECASFENIIFCDDDNWLDENYVQLAFELMKYNQDIGILGGKVDAICETKPPFWFENFKYAYAAGVQGNKDGDISYRGFVWGAGMIIRKKIWNEIKLLGIRSTLSDRVGINLSSGGDSELSLLALILGYKLWYDSRLKMEHFIPEDRLKWSYLKKLNNGFGASEISLTPLKKILASEKFSWQSEIYQTLLMILRHPGRSLKGVIGKEGESAVLWLTYYFSYINQLLKERGKLDDTFENNNVKVKKYFLEII